MWLLDFVLDVVSRVLGWLWLDGEVQRADLTAVDLLVRFSAAACVLAGLFWIFVRFLA